MLRHFPAEAAKSQKPQSRAGLPGLLLWNWFGQSCFDGQSRMSNGLRRGVTGPRRELLLHHQRKVLQFILQYR